MKLIFSILFLLFFTLSNSQIDSVTVKYSVVIGNDELMSRDKTTNAVLERAIEGSKYLEFNLSINKTESSFYLSEQLDNSNNSINYAKIHCGYTSEIYSNLKTGYNYQSYNDVLGVYVVKKESKKYEWNLTNETKFIDGFQCYKATADDVIINPAGKFSFPITAWFTPKIPISCGPLNIGGLPGLILELSKRNITFGIKSIEINPKESFVIKKPKYDKVKSIEEINKMKEEFLNNKD